MMRTIGQALLGLMAVVGVLAASPADAQIRLNPAYGEQALRGPDKALGAVVWSHGRSVESEDSEAPTPLYMKALRDAGWDVYRLDRMRVSDTLPNSSRALAAHADRLKERGYARVALTGQSFGAFISLMAAGISDRIDAVIGTAPAAFGNFYDAYDSYRDNARQLWPILHNVRNARVMLFFFHGDEFDPGGRAEPARSILSGHGIDNVVIDQPASLSGHAAAGTGLFVRRFGGCIVRFALAPLNPKDPPCDESWGRSPSADLLQAGLQRASASGSEPAAPAPAPAQRYLGTWYGTYINGREVALSIDRIEGDEIYADYLLGPGMEPDQIAERVRRKGRIEAGTLIFDEKGRNVLRYSLRADGRLAGAWMERTGKGRLETVLRRVN